MMLGRLGGVPVLLERSWLVIVVLIVVFYTPILHRMLPGIGGWAYAVSAAFCVLLALSVLLHELAHAWAARMFGWQVTHITLSLMGGHTTFERTSASWAASMVVSLSGPFTNLLLGGVGWVAITALPTPTAPPMAAIVTLVELASWANWFVGVFNLIPGLPLDGGKALEALFWRITGQEFMGTLLTVWVGRIMAAAAVLWMLVTGVWRSLPLVIVACVVIWMLLSGAASAQRRARAARAMFGIRAADLMEPAVAVPCDADLNTVELMCRHAQEPAAKPGAEPAPLAVVTDHEGRCLGVVNPHQITALSPEQRTATSLQSLLTPITNDAVISGHLSQMPLLEFTARSGQELFIIIDGQAAPQGVLRASTINTVLRDAGLLRG